METKKIEAGKIGIIVPKTRPEMAFNYSGIADLENLISFIGIKPTLEFDKGKMIPKFKKLLIPDNSIVLISQSGEPRILSNTDLTALYEIQAVSDFKKEYARPIIQAAKTAKTKK